MPVVPAEALRDAGTEEAGIPDISTARSISWGSMPYKSMLFECRSLHHSGGVRRPSIIETESCQVQRQMSTSNNHLRSTSCLVVVCRDLCRCATYGNPT
jgi:hypothetical protein